MRTQINAPAAVAAPALTYPRIMQGVRRGNLYLMVSPTSGTLISVGNRPGRNKKPGAFRTDFDPRKGLLRDFEGTVTLSNR